MSEGVAAAWEAAMELARELSPAVLKGALDEEVARAALERIGGTAGALLAVAPPEIDARVEQALSVVARAASGATLDALAEAALRLALAVSPSGRVAAEGVIEHIREVTELALDGCADGLDAEARARLQAIKAAADDDPRRGGARTARRAAAA